MPEKDNDPKYSEAAETQLQFNIGWFAHPILIDGNYPAVMREKVMPHYSSFGSVLICI